jgi:hypothetical protein
MLGVAGAPRRAAAWAQRRERGHSHPDEDPASLGNHGGLLSLQYRTSRTLGSTVGRAPLRRQHRVQRALAVGAPQLHAARGIARDHAGLGWRKRLR